MAVERQAGYEYRGWKLGEKVRLKRNGGEYSIIGFREKENAKRYIAINIHDVYSCNTSIEDSIYANSFLKSDSKFFEWVSEDKIEKIENDKMQQRTKVLYGEDAAEYLRKNYHNIFCRYEDVAEKKFIFSDSKVKCILDEEIAIRLAEEIRKKINNETLEKIKNYDYERDAEKKEQAKEFVVTEEMAKRMPERMRNEKPVFYKTDDEIKPSYYKINVAGNECEVKDVIKATVKDYDSVLVANIIKYIMRYRGKNGLEDLKKARTYLNELISGMEGKNE